MVVGNIAHYENYLFNEKFKKAFEFLQSFKKSPLPVGTYEIEGEDVFAMVQEYVPGIGGRFESHRLYTDIQFIHEGSENIGWSYIGGAVIEEDRTPASDVILYSNVKNGFNVSLNEGDFAIFFPEDLHKPCIKCNADKVVKIVVKVRV